MRARLFVLLFAFVVLIALTWMSPVAPVSTTVFAQQRGAQPAAQGQQAQGPGQQAGPGVALGRGKTLQIRGGQRRKCRPPTGIVRWDKQLQGYTNFGRTRYFRGNTPRPLRIFWT